MNKQYPKKLKSLSNKIFSTVFLFAIFCVAASAKNSIQIDSAQWVLIEIKNKAVAQNKAFIEFNLAENRIAGNAGCNRMFGTAEIADGNRIKFSGIGTTKMFCGQPKVMKLEQDFINYLGQTTRYKQTGKTLSLYAGKRLLLKFKANESFNGASDLEEKKWTLVAIESKKLQNVSKVPYFVFDKSAGKFSGNFGCNSGAGNYETSGEQILFKEIITTEMACDEPATGIEREFLDALLKANRYAVEKQSLKLYSGNKLLLTFDAQDK